MILTLLDVCASKTSDVVGNHLAQTRFPTEETKISIPKKMFESLDCQNILAKECSDSSPNTDATLYHSSQIDDCTTRDAVYINRIIVASTKSSASQLHPVGAGCRSISDIDGYSNKAPNHLYKNMLLHNRWFCKKHQWTQQVLNHQKLKQNKNRQANGTTRPFHRGGTKFTMFSPSPERLCRWFPRSTTTTTPQRPGIDAYNTIGRGSSSLLHHSNPFNHNNPGMTNPMHHHTEVLHSHQSSIDSIRAHGDDDRHEELFMSTYPKNVGMAPSTVCRSEEINEPPELFRNRKSNHPSYSIEDVMPVLSIRGALHNRRTQYKEQEESQLSQSYALNSTSKKKSEQPSPDTYIDIPSNCWWPTVKSDESRAWRIKRYRKRVGYGHEVYEACRDAALNWEFTMESNHGGIMIIPEQPNMNHRKYKSGKWMKTDVNENNVQSTLPSHTNFQEIWSGVGQRLVTYTRNPQATLGPQRMRSNIPSVYTINPVQVIYNIIDQRGGHGTIFTSTAYGTLRGHALCGEERVTVCYRDNSANNDSIHHIMQNTNQGSSSSSHLHHPDNCNGAVDIEIVSYSKPSETLIGKLVWPFIGGIQENFFQQQLRALEQVARTRVQLKFEQ